MGWETAARRTRRARSWRGVRRTGRSAGAVRPRDRCCGRLSGALSSWLPWRRTPSSGSTTMRHFFLVPAAAALLVFAPPPETARAGGNCAVTSTGLVPVNDLGAGFYKGAQGGLYPGGSNARPPAHDAAGLAIANSIAPLDTFGNPDPSGRVVLISIGMSNTTMEFSHFVPKAMTNAARNPRLLVIDCAEGGQSADRILDPGAAYWSFVSGRLRQSGSAPAQVQAVWLKEAIARPTGGFPAATDTLMRDLGTIVRLIKQKMPA